MDGEKEEETENDKKKQSQDDIDETVAKCKLKQILTFFLGHISMPIHLTKSNEIETCIIMSIMSLC